MLLAGVLLVVGEASLDLVGSSSELSAEVRSIDSAVRVRGVGALGEANLGTGDLCDG